MKLTDLVFFPNVPIRTLDGLGIVTGIPDFNAKSPIIKVKFKNIRSKPNCLDCGKLSEYWDTVDYGYYVLNNNNKIILRDIFEMTIEEATRLGYDLKLFSVDFIRRTLYEKILIDGLDADQFKNLCHLHFDVFRWIKKKQAFSYQELTLTNT
jgi:hypothetical protein